MGSNEQAHFKCKKENPKSASAMETKLTLIVDFFYTLEGITLMMN